MLHCMSLTIEEWSDNQLEVDWESLPQGNYHYHSWGSNVPQIDQRPCLVDIFHKNASLSGCSSKSRMLCLLYVELIHSSNHRSWVSVASALEFLDNDATQQTCLFIRMINFLIVWMPRVPRWPSWNERMTLLLTQEHLMSDSRWELEDSTPFDLY